MKAICFYEMCAKEFDKTRESQRYCCKSCKTASWRLENPKKAKAMIHGINKRIREKIDLDPKRREKHLAIMRKYRLKHREELRVKARIKYYERIRRLPEQKLFYPYKERKRKDEITESVSGGNL